MSRDLNLYLEDIQISCQKIVRYSSGMRFEEFVKNDLHYDAVIRNLEIIGEAIKNISDSFRKKYPQVEWRAIGALRNIVAHEYFGVKKEIIWDIIRNKIPALQSQIESILAENKK